MFRSDVSQWSEWLTLAFCSEPGCSDKYAQKEGNWALQASRKVYWLHFLPVGAIEMRLGYREAQLSRQVAFLAERHFVRM